MLTRRPRLAFPADEVPVVHQVLVTHAPSVAARAAPILAAVARALDGSSMADRRQG
jgi:hypothetical protein